MGASEVPISVSAGSAQRELRAWEQTLPKATWEQVP